ncbi:hypothetical protein [Gemmobacter serpentinus]|uniref:hypothetical protein n=1 Tax=Gemmobacter serpentinus TaxID=2652247 RepID=UPI00124C7BFA|nr:hypothetical protein [Gemmobacter serpentinus]
MTKPLLAALTLVLFTSACGGFSQSRLNPVNWFGRAEPAAAAPVIPARPADPRALAGQITDLKMEPMPGGAILRATAVMPTQGWWEAELVAVDKEPVDGKMVYEFRTYPPINQAGVSTPHSRSITAAVFLSDIKLSRINSVTVQGATNGMTTRR